MTFLRDITKMLVRLAPQRSVEVCGRPLPFLLAAATTGGSIRRVRSRCLAARTGEAAPARGSAGKSPQAERRQRQAAQAPLHPEQPFPPFSGLSRRARAQAVKGQIVVNPKRLYKADQTAVPELLKVAAFLYGASTPPSSLIPVRGFPSVAAALGCAVPCSLHPTPLLLERRGRPSAPRCSRPVLQPRCLLPCCSPCAEAHLAAKADALNPRPAAPAPDFMAVLKARRRLTRIAHPSPPPSSHLPHSLPHTPSLLSGR